MVGGRLADGLVMGEFKKALYFEGFQPQNVPYFYQLTSYVDNSS